MKRDVTDGKAAKVYFNIISTTTGMSKLHLESRNSQMNV